MMSHILDRVFNEVCLDERISDGIFRMEEEQHMNALRDYFVKKGITQEAAVNVTNRMVEGKYPDRQAYRTEDGILVTWPSPQHKAKAMQENPGKYTEQKPAVAKSAERAAEPEKKEKPEPKEEPPVKEPMEDPEGDKPLPKSGGGGGGSSPKVKQGDKELSIEPPRGSETAEAPPPPAAPPTPPPVPRTPQRVAAEKEVAAQIINTDDNALTKIEPQLNESCRRQLTELLIHADKMDYRDAVSFLIKYVNP